MLAIGFVLSAARATGIALSRACEGLHGRGSAVATKGCGLGYEDMGSSGLHIALHFIEQILDGIQTLLGVVDFQQFDLVFLGEWQQVRQLVGQ